MVNRKLNCKELTKKQMEKKYNWYNKFRAISCSPELGGCIKASKNIKRPKKTKIVMCDDKKAIKLRQKK